MTKKRGVVLSLLSVCGMVSVLAGLTPIFASYMRGTLPVAAKSWPPPTGKEIAAADEPRYYSAEEDAVLTLTTDSIKLHNTPVIQSGSDEDLDLGVIHLPETPMPGENKAQKNVYLAGHRVGNPGTTGRMIFYKLDKLSPGDSIVLEDRSGNTYEYQVSESFVVEPDAQWAMDSVKDRDMVTLQTCTYPGGENRIIVRADRI